MIDLGILLRAIMGVLYSKNIHVAILCVLNNFFSVNACCSIKKCFFCKYLFFH